MDYVEAIEAALGREAKKVFLPMQPGDVTDTHASVELLQELAGHVPKITVREGVRRFVEWYRAYYKIDEAEQRLSERRDIDDSVKGLVHWSADDSFWTTPTFTLANRLFRLLFAASWLLLCRWTPVPLHAWRALVLRAFGAKLAGGVAIYPDVRIWHPANLEMGEAATLGPRVNCYSMAKISLGRRAIVSARRAPVRRQPRHRRPALPARRPPHRHRRAGLGRGRGLRRPGRQHRRRRGAGRTRRDDEVARAMGRLCRQSGAEAARQAAGLRHTLPSLGRVCRRSPTGTTRLASDTPPRRRCPRRSP